MARADAETGSLLLDIGPAGRLRQGEQCVAGAHSVALLRPHAHHPGGCHGGDVHLGDLQRTDALNAAVAATASQQAGKQPEAEVPSHRAAPCRRRGATAGGVARAATANSAACLRYACTKSAGGPFDGVAEEDPGQGANGEEVRHDGHGGDCGEPGIEIGTKHAAPLTLFDHAAQAPEHGSRDQLELVHRVAGGVVDQLPQHEPVKVRMSPEDLAEQLEKRAEPGLRTPGRVQPLHAVADDLADQPVEHRLVEALLVPEVIVEQRAVHPGLGGDVLDGGGDESLGGKAELGGVEDSVPGGGAGDGGHGASLID